MTRGLVKVLALAKQGSGFSSLPPWGTLQPCPHLWSVPAVWSDLRVLASVVCSMAFPSPGTSAGYIAPSTQFWFGFVFNVYYLAVSGPNRGMWISVASCRSL